MSKIAGTLFLIFSFLLFSCKPYNSNKVNTTLIEGRWLLVDVDSKKFDSITVDYTTELTYLIFRGDSCIQQLIDIDETSYFTFSVNNFYLNLMKDSAIVSSLRIDKLTSDSLVLSTGANDVWRYKKDN